MRAVISQYLPAVQVAGLNTDVLTAKADTVSESTYSVSPGEKVGDQAAKIKHTTMKSQKPAQKLAGTIIHR